MSKQPIRAYSGIQPSGAPHLGNDLGAIRNYVALQENYESIYCIVDYHALTSVHDGEKLRRQTREMAAALIALGLDPNKCTLFVQSHRPEVQELAWILMTVTPVSWVERTPTYKEKKAQQADDINHGLLTYPILQAADILLYQPKAVPVGEDQRQHLELTRDLAERFNSRFGKTFTIPEAHILKETAKIYDLQNPTAKMSKSAADPKGLVNMMDDDATIAKKIKSAVTDTEGSIKLDWENKPGVSNLLSIHSSLSGESVISLEERFSGAGYGVLKAEVAEVVISAIGPIRDRANDLMSDQAELDRLLASGAEKAKTVANQTLAAVYDRVGFIKPE